MATVGFKGLILLDDRTSGGDCVTNYNVATVCRL